MTEWIYDGCNCTLSTLVSMLERAEKAEALYREEMEAGR